MRKVACVLLVLVMLLGVLAFAACNEASNTNSPEPTPVDYFTFEPNSDRTGYVLTGTQKILPADVVIPAEYEGLPVTMIGSSAFEGCTEIGSIVILDNITYIGDGAFKQCTTLTSVALPNTITTINENTFLSCTSLENINLPEGLEYIRMGAFENCSSLTTLKFPRTLKLIYSTNVFNAGSTSIAENIDDMLSSSNSYVSIITGCDSLQNIELCASTKVGKGAFSGASLTTDNILILD